MDTFLDPSDFRQKADTTTFEAYKLETHGIVERFLSGQTNFPACIAALNSAFAALIPDFDDLCELRAVMQANNETVMQEIVNDLVVGIVGTVQSKDEVRAWQ